MLADQFKTEQNQFDRLGHPGRITHVHRFTGGQVDFTGSMYGYGAVKVVGAGDASASLSGGGSIPLTKLASQAMIYPISVKQISGSANDSDVYVFKVQGTV